VEPDQETTDRGGQDSGVPDSPSSDEIAGLVRSLAGMMDGGISELDVTFGVVSIRLRGSTSTAPRAAVEVSPDPTADEIAIAAGESEHVITAPMIGTFYASPSPGEPLFVQVGDAIEAGQVVGVIEAMKIMNEIIADRSGVVTAVMVGNAQPVEYGSPLIRLGAAA
jgi:acetyl-CoA carboxylase biotin carboxyl carrier protein